MFFYTKNTHKILAILLLLLSAAILPQAATAQTPPIYIKGGYYFDVDSGEMIKNEGILIRGGAFFEVGDSPDPNEPHDYKVIKLSDNQYILPGLIDVHAHFRMDAFGSEKLEEIDEFKYNAIIYLANGVTSTFSNGVYYPKLEMAASRLITGGEWVGPRMFTSGPYFGSARPGWEPHTKQEIFNEVDYWINHGVDGFKAKGASPETIKYLVQRAHMHGATVAGHVSSGIENSTNSITAINLGIDRIEHILGGFVLDSTRYAYPVWVNADTSTTAFKKTVEYFIDHHVYFDPTINAPVYYMARKEEILDRWVNETSFFTPYVQRLVENSEESEPNELMANLYEAMLTTTNAFYEAGGGHLITLGSDAPSSGKFLAGFSVQREMKAMVKAGIPEAAVLRIATQNSANAIGQGTLLGSIETGKLADLFVVKGNPLKDITNTRNIQVVIKAGHLYQSEELLQAVKGKIGPEGPEEANDWFKYDKLMQEIEGELVRSGQ